MMELFVLIANGFKLLTKFAEAPYYMFNKVLNVPLVSLTLSKMFGIWILWTIKKNKTKILKLCSPQMLLSKEDLEHLIL